MSVVINIRTSEIIYTGKEQDCDCFVGENDLRNEDDIEIVELPCDACNLSCPYRDLFYNEVMQECLA